MNPDSKRLFDNFTANRASLRCASGVDFLVHSPGAFSLGFEYGQEDTPRSICNAFGKVSVLEHVLDIEVFNSDIIVLFNERISGLVAEIKALIRNLLMTVRDKVASLAPSIATLLPARQSLLRGFKFLFGEPKELRRVDLFPVARGNERVKSDINTDIESSMRQDHGITFNGKGNVPLVVSATNTQGLDRTTQFAMPLDLDVADILNVKFASLNLAPITKRCVVDRIESVGRLESGIAWILARLYSSEERLERLIQTAQGLLKRTIIAKRKAINFLFKFWQKSCGLGAVSDTLSGLFVSLFSLSKGLIVEKAMPIKLLSESTSLFTSWIEAIFESLNHLLPFLPVNVFADSRFTYGPHATCKIASTPKRREATAKRCKFLSQNTAGIAFQAVHNLGNASCRAMLNKQMNVIRHHFKRMNRKAKLSCLFVEKFFEPLLDSALKNFAPVFRAPYYVQFQAENSTSILCVAFILFHEPNYMLSRYIMQAKS